jgi:hypothetical protein
MTNRFFMKLTLLATFVSPACSLHGIQLNRGTPQGSAYFRNSSGVISIDVGALVISVEGHDYPLENCSDDALYCFKNAEIGFHIVFPRDCRRPYRATEVLGGARFLEIALALHQRARDGRYSSELSDRFAYDYRVRGGLQGIYFDPSGRWRFGPNSNGDALGSDAREPYLYRLAEGRTFLQCSGPI